MTDGATLGFVDDGGKRDATYDDIVALPDHVVGEIVDGELHVSPRPASPHARASSKLGNQLGPPFDDGRGGPGGWIILDEPELHEGKNVLVPDLAGWRRERMPAMPDAAWFELSPDWLCEVLSPSTARFDRDKKLKRYLAIRVTHVWLIDPIARTLEVLEHDPAGYRIVDVFSGDAKVCARPFDAIELELGALWSR
jgi:Uma2 family endonuclease